MTNGWFVTSGDIKQWTKTNKRRAEELLPLLIRNLIYASCKPKHLHFPSGDSVSVGGWDGTLEIEDGNEFIPKGKSVWEFGTNENIQAKADEDYKKRTDNPKNLNPSETTFMFVTSLTWQKKESWCTSKNAEKVWLQVNGINADDLENWLQRCPGVHRWFATLIGKRAETVWDIEQAWDSWVHGTSIPATYELVQNGRTKQSEELSKSLKGEPTVICIKASSENEAYAFCLATLIKDEELAPRVLIVKEQNQFDVLLDTQNTLILMPQEFIPANRGYARQKGHFTVIPVNLSNPIKASNEIQLERMSRNDRINALQSMGLSNDQAEKIYADTRGYLGPIRRHEIVGPQDYIIPEWVDQFNPDILIAILLATEWDNKKEKDKEAVSRLAATPYEQFEQRLYELCSKGDSPVRLVGSIWQVVSKIDLWSLIAHKINKQSIERFEPVVFDVLGEPDPSYDLAPEERWLANIKGAVPEYSEALRSGLADSIALLAVYGDVACQNLGEVNLTDRVAYWVRVLLTKDISAPGWYSFGRNLIPLAEAAPESFLYALESSMQGGEPPIAPIFMEEGEFGGFPHANLLWALETISWNLDYLSRVALALARLSEIDPVGRYRTRPLGSLKEIFIGWINNTRASHEERLQIIDSNLVKFYPDVAWQLLISLLPERTGGFSTPIHKPDYRDWAEDIKKEVSNRDYHRYVEGIVDRLLNLVNKELKSRWPELIENITRLPEEKFKVCIEKLLAVTRDELGNEVRLRIADKLRFAISSNREFEEAQWALPKKAINNLEEAFNFIVPENPQLKNKYLFDEHIPHLIDPVVRRETDYPEREEIVGRYRRDALVEIYQTAGIDGIRQLASSCSYPSFIGNAMAKSELRSLVEEELLSWLEACEVSLITAAQSFVFACANIDPNGVRTILEQCESWNKDKFVNFLLGLPFDQTTFDILNDADREIKEMYWIKVRNYILNDRDLDKINWVVEQLLVNRRPLAAVDAAAQVLYNSRRKVPLDCSLLVNVLKKIVVDPTDNEQTPILQVRYDILKTIEYIQEQEELRKEEIAQIEWMYLTIFRFESVKPRYLQEEIIKNPAFFMQLVSWIYKSDESERELEEMDEESLKYRAKNTWELLQIVSGIPGQQAEGSIDAKELKEWVYKAREQLERAGRKKIGDDQIGKILSNSPVREDGVWPHETVRDLIEELQSHELDKALEVGKWNSRGVTSRLPFDGGKQELELAEKYREQAEKIKLKWPRTSEILRCLERSYKHDADWEDRQVEQRE